MNRQTKQYIKELKAHLKCGRSLRKQVLSDFLPALTSFLEDVPSPTRPMLEEAFGPPLEMARVLMKSVSRNDKPAAQEEEGCSKLSQLFLPPSSSHSPFMYFSIKNTQ